MSLGKLRRDGKVGRKIKAFDPRQHMFSGRYEVFHYRDRYLNDIALHHHDFYEVYLFLAGDVTYSIENRSYVLQPGDVLLINPMELHRPIIANPKLSYERIVLWMEPGFLSMFQTDRTNLELCFSTSVPIRSNLLRPDAENRAKITHLLTRLVSESEDSTYGGDVVSVALIIELLVLINRLHTQLPAQQIEYKDKSERMVADVLHFIHENYHAEISLDSLSTRFYISKFHLSHEFNRIVGTSVYHYIIKKRLIMAKQLLNDSVPSTQAYRQCGFGDYANFYRSFKTEYGISPKEYARRQAE